MSTEANSQKEKENNFKTAIKEILNGNLHTTDQEKKNESEKASTKEIQPLWRESSQEKNAGEPSAIAVDDTLSSDESVITKDMVVDGNITLKAKIRILGSVKGNVISTNDILVEGSIEGDVKGNNIQMTNAKIQGNLSAKSSIKLNETSVLSGDAHADQVYCDGNIKGNIEASGLVALNQTAEVLGNIHAQSLRIQDNAIIKGNIDIFRDENRKAESRTKTDKS